MIANLDAVIDMARAESQIRPGLDDADVEAEEIMGLMLREGQNLAVRRKIAARLREFASGYVLGAMGAGA